jgi:hypothetical protein
VIIGRTSDGIQMSWFLEICRVVILFACSWILDV